MSGTPRKLATHFHGLNFKPQNWLEVLLANKISCAAKYFLTNVTVRI